MLNYFDAEETEHLLLCYFVIFTDIQIYANIQILGLNCKMMKVIVLFLCWFIFIRWYVQTDDN